MPGKLCNPCHNRSPGSYVHTVSPSRRIINLAQTTVGKLRHHPAQNTVIVKRPCDDLHTRCIQILLINLCQRRQHSFPVPIIQIETKGLCDISQVCVCLLHNRPGNLLQLVVFLIGDILCIDLLIDFLIPYVFPVNNLIVQLKHLRVRGLQRFLQCLFDIL